MSFLTGQGVPDSQLRPLCGTSWDFGPRPQADLLLSVPPASPQASCSRPLPARDRSEESAMSNPHSPPRAEVGAAAPGAGRGTLTPRSLKAFFAMAFGIGWGLAASVVLFPQLGTVFGPVGYPNPLFILAVWAPGIAGVTLVLRHHGLAGLHRFLRR